MWQSLYSASKTIALFSVAFLAIFYMVNHQSKRVIVDIEPNSRKVDIVNRTGTPMWTATQIQTNGEFHTIYIIHVMKRLEFP